MHQREAAKRPETHIAKPPDPGRCAQCRDVLEAERIDLLGRGEPVLCRDCAFDPMPCTD